MSYRNLINALIQTIPELEQAYKNALEWWDGKQPGAHNIFGDVLNPFLIEQLNLMDHRRLIERIFNFFELMALSEDEKVKEVLACTVLERLGDDKLILQKAWPFMKENTKRISNDIEKGLGRL